MIIKVGKPLAFSEIGRKDNQEDSIYPKLENLKPLQSFFILCDGMGGHEHGEVASQTVCDALGHYLETNPDSKGSVEGFNLALSAAYDRLDEVDSGEDTAKKMGTTMTCVSFHKKGYLVAHIGDSRIYHFRPSMASPKNLGILYQSYDHSLVNSLLKAGEITEEEARDFPQKNVITRAMQPHQGTRAKAEVYAFSDIEEGDYFFLCCDGVLENLDNQKLSRIICAGNMSDGEKLAAIKSECEGRTRDNYTCILIPINKVVKGVGEKSVNRTETIIADTEDTVETSEGSIIATSPTLESTTQRQGQKKKGLSKITIFFLMALVACTIIIVCTRFMCKNNHPHDVLNPIEWLSRYKSSISIQKKSRSPQQDSITDKTIIYEPIVEKIGENEFPEE